LGAGNPLHAPNSRAIANSSTAWQDGTIIIVRPRRNDAVSSGLLLKEPLISVGQAANRKGHHFSLPIGAMPMIETSSRQAAIAFDKMMAAKCAQSGTEDRLRTYYARTYATHRKQQSAGGFSTRAAIPLKI